MNDLATATSFDGCVDYACHRRGLRRLISRFRLAGLLSAFVGWLDATTSSTADQLAHGLLNAEAAWIEKDWGATLAAVADALDTPRALLSVGMSGQDGVGVGVIPRAPLAVQAVAAATQQLREGTHTGKNVQEKKKAGAVVQQHHEGGFFLEAQWELENSTDADGTGAFPYNP